jgi:hypothetical protein
MLTQLNTWWCLDIRIKEEITIKKLVEKDGRVQINEDIKSKLRSGNAGYQSEQHILTFGCLLQNYKEVDVQKYYFPCGLVWERKCFLYI